jgi:secernin
LNGAKVVAGCLPLEVRLRGPQPGLAGPDLVRLVLERSHTACHAVDVLVDLIDRYGQGGTVDEASASACDHAFLIADAREAVLVETAGKHWVAQEIGEVRGLVSARTIRQDWDRISKALSDQVIHQGAWPADGSKIDFVGAIGDAPEQHPLAFNRWGRAMFLLQEQNGHIDAGVLRRLMRDHGEESEGSWMPSIGQVSSGACRHAGKLAGSATQASFIACLSKELEIPPMAWIAFGPPCRSVFFPVVLSGWMPEALSCDGPESLAEQVGTLQRRMAAQPESWPEMREEFDRLQAEFDQCADDYLAAASHSVGDTEALEREGHSLMEHCARRFELVLSQVVEQGSQSLEFAPGV